ncbi:hypothetical protein NC981_00995 [Leptolyngbya sp. DQ-M1]|uniref:hypothetical protein n=1 Tax=Leptolyngbya sp. DQ-M1 TaxID=2933920 RepID=UPI00329A1F4E
MDLRQYYQNLISSSEATLNESLQKLDELAKVHAFTEDLLIWHEVVHTRVGATVVRYAAGEIQLSALSLAYGLYRQAFTSLRLSLELSLSAIFFSTNELEFREWEQGKRDIYWNQLVDVNPDTNNGIFSKRYAKAFFPELEDSVAEYNKLARNTYRDLSEFVHGNAYTWEMSTSSIGFDDALFHRWITNFGGVSRIISFGLTLRFLKSLERGEISSLKAHLQEYLGTIPAIREVIGGAL